MGRRPSRQLLPWEQHCGCATCKAKPGQRCRTLATRYPATSFAYPRMVNRETAPHKARIDLWTYLWGRTS